ncbi:MFS transporter [Fervidibacillus halotolerans]|uniref:MFS transporter n=1 Tax=Fervidibacillus halotolerans TaxID=2980027 RepID=A0A9E8M017_9BACI|nr:MFS transporter [Fervidibacillus halotolerans]WAA12440.1 MFS transporter [Fervidibacillus halotolerans]
MGHYRFWILIGVVLISGFSQGMLLPVIAIIFENGGISSSLNGLHATALYIGILIASPFMEKPLRKYGYKPVIIIGGAIVIVSLFLFPLWKSFLFWFVLRLLIGIGDHALHFGTETWITSFSPIEKRGRNISIYGLSFGLGFALGPLMAPLVEMNESLPFILSTGLCFTAWLFLFFIQNEFPEDEIGIQSVTSTFQRFRQAFKYAWVAFLPPFGYGFLEASLNGSFPVYALRIGFDVSTVSILLTSFAIGGIVFQLPLGMMSDKFGRKRVLQIILFFGGVCFLFAGVFEHAIPIVIMLLFIAGMFVGSTFSLGISFMTDLTPKNLLPTGNLLCGIAFSFGSLIGPYTSGIIIQYFEQIRFFSIVSFMLFIIFIVVMFTKQKESMGKRISIFRS